MILTDLRTHMKTEDVESHVLRFHMPTVSACMDTL